MRAEFIVDCRWRSRAGGPRRDWCTTQTVSMCGPAVLVGLIRAGNMLFLAIFGKNVEDA
jgi:hypothetical protein